MRLHGKYIDATDLEDHLKLCMQRYLDEAGKIEGVMRQIPLSASGSCGKS